MFTHKNKVIIVGCGGMAQTWVRYATNRKDLKISALVDINKQNAENTKKEFKLKCPIFCNLEEAINNTESDILFDITIPSSHKKVVTTAINSGLKVLGEKPMATNFLEVKEVLDVVSKNNGFYAVMQNRRYLKHIRAFKSLLNEDTIGNIGYVGADFFLGPHFGGFREIMDNPLLLDMAIHTFDQARFLIGSNPTSVYCHEFNPKGSWYKGNSSAICIFEFQNGSVFCYRGSWSAEGANTSWQSEWRVQGSKGTAMWDGENTPYAEILKDDNNKFINEHKNIMPTFDWDGREGHEGCLDEMFNAIKENRKAETDCKDNAYSMAMVFAAIESAKRSKKIDIIL